MGVRGGGAGSRAIGRTWPWSTSEPVTTSPTGSFSGLFSSMSRAASLMTGGSFTSCTAMTTCATSESAGLPLSVTVTVRV